MKVITHSWANLTRSDSFTLYPISDVHLGSIACDEKRFQAEIDAIEADPSAYWISLGDCCELVNRMDRRFDQDSVAPWLRFRADMATAQVDKFLDMTAPIAAKCLGMVSGNHEYSILQHTENDAYSRMVIGMKENAGHDKPLALGTAGWLVLKFGRGRERGQHGTDIVISVAHGHTGGRLAGGKALDLERWLWTHDCDLALLGHSHVVQVIPGAVDCVSRGAIVRKHRIDVICGSYLTLVTPEDTYPERKGYLPITNRTPIIRLKPHAENRADQIRVTV